MPLSLEHWGVTDRPRYPVLCLILEEFSTNNRIGFVGGLQIQMGYVPICEYVTS